MDADLLALIEVEDVPEVADIEAAIERWHKEAATEIEMTQAVRQLTLRMQAAEAQADKVADLRARVVAPYDVKLSKAQADAARARASIDALVDRLGEKVSWPDIGTWYHSTRHPSPKVEDVDVFAKWCTEHGYLTAVEADIKAGLAVVKSDGLAEVPGVTWPKSTKSLAFRAASV